MRRRRDALEGTEQGDGEIPGDRRPNGRREGGFEARGGTGRADQEDDENHGTVAGIRLTADFAAFPNFKEFQPSAPASRTLAAEPGGRYRDSDSVHGPASGRKRPGWVTDCRATGKRRRDGTASAFDANLRMAENLHRKEFSVRSADLPGD